MSRPQIAIAWATPALIRLVHDDRPDEPALVWLCHPFDLSVSGSFSRLHGLIALSVDQESLRSDDARDCLLLPIPPRIFALPPTDYPDLDPYGGAVMEAFVGTASR